MSVHLYPATSWANAYLIQYQWSRTLPLLDIAPLRFLGPKIIHAVLMTHQPALILVAGAVLSSLHDFFLLVCLMIEQGGTFIIPMS